MKPYPAYKDSGVEWIGEIPEHWDIDRLKWSVTLCKNGIWGGEPDGENDLICVRVADFDRHTNQVVLNEPTIRSIKPNERNERVLIKGDLLLEKSGGGEQQPVGFVVLYDYDQEAVCSNFVARMPIAKNHDSRYWNYLHNYLYSIRVNTRSIKQTTGIQNLDSYSYLSEYVGIPPLAEQTAIAAYLDRKTAQIDTLIDRKRRLIDLLQEERTAAISHAVTKGLNPNAPLKDSGVVWIGAVPESWEVKRLKFICDTTKGYAFKTTVFKTEGFPVVKASNIKNGTIINVSEFISEDDAIAYSKVELRYGDLVISTVGSTPDVTNSAVGQIALVPKEFDGSYLNQNTVRFELKENTNVNFGFLFYSIDSYPYRKYLDLHAHGTANQASLNIRDMLFYSIPIPPIEEQTTIAAYLDRKTAQIDQTIDRTQRQIELLQEYRTALISAAVTGKIDVRQEVSA